MLLENHFDKTSIMNTWKKSSLNPICESNLLGMAAWQRMVNLAFEYSLILELISNDFANEYSLIFQMISQMNIRICTNS